jgi:hypothetical protein
MLTSSNVAHLFNVHINTARYWCEQGIIKAFRFINGKFAVMQTILAFIHQNGGAEKGCQPLTLSTIAIDKGDNIEVWK